jgi:hypothetical protein
VTPTRDPDRLYELLPFVHRLRDAERGYPLKALLRIIGEQAQVLEDDIDRLYENWFIETCDDWVVPYIGDLIGVQPAVDAGLLADVASFEGRLKNRVLVPRREVANAVALRRRKGTLAVLELLANDVAGWPSRAVEFYKLLGVTQPIRHLRMERGRTCDLRNGDVLDRLDGAFDEVAHTVDVRRPSSHRAQGKYNIPSVGVFVFRLQSYTVTKTQAYCHESVGQPGQNCFTFSVLGNDAPLFTAPRREEDPSHIGEELDLPVPIRRLAFAENKADYYGEGKSLHIWRQVDSDGKKEGEQKKEGEPKRQLVAVPIDDIVVADLSKWFYRAQGSKVLVDPELGRFVLAGSDKSKGVRVSYRYGFSAGIGGGEYRRPMLQPPAPLRRYVVGPGHFKVNADGKVALDQEGNPEVIPEFRNIREAVCQWEEDDPPRAIIEIAQSGVYSEPLRINLKAGQSLEIRAADGVRPVLRLLDYEPDAADALSVQGEERSSLTIDGLIIMGRGLKVTGPLARLILRHTTLVPGWEVGREPRAGRPVEPSLQLSGITGEVRIERSILGPIRFEAEGEPPTLAITDSIVDALGRDNEAISTIAPGFARVVLALQRVTVFGKISVHAVGLVENSILLGHVRVARRQLGCVRFCYVPPESRTPKRHHCQPDLVLRDAPQGSPESLKQSEEARVEPVWTSKRYGDPGYAQLSATCADEIGRGADDEGAMGVFHNLFEPQRSANLRTRLDEFTPAGTDAGIFFVT